MRWSVLFLVGALLAACGTGSAVESPPSSTAAASASATTVAPTTAASVDTTSPPATADDATAAAAAVTPTVVDSTAPATAASVDTTSPPTAADDASTSTSEPVSSTTTVAASSTSVASISTSLPPEPADPGDEEEWTVEDTVPPEPESGAGEAWDHRKGLGPQRAAILFVKEAGVAARFDPADLMDRVHGPIAGMVDAFSYGQVTLTAERFGWYEFGRDAFCGIASGWPFGVLDDPSLDADPPDLTGFDLVVVVVDTVDRSDPACSVPTNGQADPNPTTITVAGRTYDTRFMTLFHNSGNGYLATARFFPEQNYDPAADPYHHPDGADLTAFDGLFVHEYIHTQGFAGHATTKLCDGGVLTGRCSVDHYNQFDVISSARFFGLSLSANHRSKIGWLPEDRVLEIATDGTYTIGHLNARSGYVAARVPIDGWDERLWIEHRIPGAWDYGLHAAPFADVRNGLLLHDDDELLDASPPGLPADGSRPVLRDAAATDRVHVDPLGVTISDIRADASSGTVTFSVTLDGLTPTRAVPRPGLFQDGCIPWNGNPKCTVAAGTSTEVEYGFATDDIGYGETFDTPFGFEVVGLPFATTATPVSRNYPPPRQDWWSANPLTIVTIDVPAGTAPGEYDFEFRYWNVADPSKGGVLDQRLTVTG